MSIATEPTKPITLADIGTLDGYLTHYGPTLAQRTEEALVPLHKPGKDPLHPVVTSFLRQPFEAQAHVVTAVAKHLDRQKSAILVGEMGTGKEQPNFSPVLTPTGWKPIGDMQVGDEVVNPEGGTSKVVAVYPQGEKDYYRVTFTDGSSTLCGLEHLWFVNSPLRKWRGNPGKAKTLHEIMDNGLAHANGNLQHFIPMVKPVEFPEQELPVDPYLLGYLLGHAATSGKSIQVAAKDEEIVERIDAILKRDFGGTLRMRLRSNSDYAITATRGEGNPLLVILKQLEVMTTRSEEKVTPSMYMSGSISQRTALLQGLLDAHGLVAAEEEGASIEFCSTSKQLASDVVYLVQSLGGTATNTVKSNTSYSYKGEKMTGQVAYRVFISLPNEIVPFRLSRKAKAYKPKTKYSPARAIKSITLEGHGPCTCIGVDSRNHLYVTDEFIVTHNTFMGMASVHAHANGRDYRALIFCPGHLVNKWQRELEETIPGAIVHQINHWTDLLGLSRHQPKHGAEWWIVPRDRAKLGAKWRPLALTKSSTMRCPKCGQVQADHKAGIPLGVDHFLGKADKKGKRSPIKRTCIEPQRNDFGAVIKDGTGKPIPCGEPLWQETGELRRVAPADYIHRRLRRFFDYFIVDEVHEEKGAETAQGNALGRLAASCKKVIALTGTLIGGKADHLRPLLFRLCPKTLIAEGHEWKRPLPFSEQYGRIETRITTSTKEDNGGPSNRQSRGQQQAGKTTKYIKPGILPTVFGRHLIGNSVFLLLDEVAHALPELEETVVPVPMDAELEYAYKKVEKAFADEINTLIGMKGPGGAAKLLGPMLSTLLCYPDYPYDWSAVGYTGDEGWVEVCTPDTLDFDQITAKEQTLLDEVKREWFLGRQCWVFVTFNGKHNVQGRLGELLKGKGLRVCELNASVPLEKREEWIAKNGPKYDVILSNPKLVETGLDLFDKGGKHNFSSLFFYETGYNLFTVRQASRRAWRIGQKFRCKVRYLYWQGTMEERAIALMGKKMAAAQAIDGRFSTEGLSAMAEDEAIEMQLAKSLADALPEDAAREWSKIGEVEEEEERDILPFEKPDEDDSFYDDLEKWLDEEVG